LHVPELSKGPISLDTDSTVHGHFCRFQRGRFLQVGECAFEQTKVVLGKCTLEVGFGIVVLELECPVIIDDRVLEPTKAGPGEAPVEVGVGTVGLGQENLVIVGDGRLILAHFLPCKAPAEDGTDMTWLQPEGQVVFDDGLLV